MKNISRREFALGTAVAAAAASTTAIPAFADSPANRIVIFHTNDIHGNFQGDGKSCAGIDLVAALKAQEPDALLLDAGDATQGAPIASLSQGADPIALMNAAGYDAMCLGNHEFDYGQDTLRANAAAANFPLMAANVTDSQGAPLLQGITNAAGNLLDGCSTVLECGGRRIGVFGILTAATPWNVMPSKVEGVQFGDEVEAAEAQIMSLADQGVDAIVCLAHIGDTADVPVVCADMAEQLSPAAAAHLTVIIDGHSHTVENVVSNGVLVVQTGCNLGNVGKVTLEFGADGSVSATEELLSAEEVAGLVQPEPTTAQALDEIVAEQDAFLSVELFDNPTTLWGGKVLEGDLNAPARMVQTNFGDLVCDAYISEAQAYLRQVGKDGLPVVSVCNGGGFRAKVARGTVTKRSLVTAFPFSNTIQLKLVSPSMLRALLEAGFSVCDGLDEATGMLQQTSLFGNYNQVGGFAVTVDPNKAQNERVLQVVLDGADTPLDLEDEEPGIVLVSNSYVMTGGSLPEMGDVPLFAEVSGDLECIEGYFGELAQANGGSLPLATADTSRVVYAGYEPLQTWPASVRVADNGGQPLATRELAVLLDAGEAFDVETDAFGVFTLEVPDGPHALAVMGSTDEVYLDNHMGVGLVEDEHRVFPQLII